MVIITTHINENPENTTLLNSIHLKVTREENGQEIYSKKLQKHNEKIVFKVTECINFYNELYN